MPIYALRNVSQKGGDGEGCIKIGTNTLSGGQKAGDCDCVGEEDRNYVGNKMAN